MCEWVSCDSRREWNEKEESGVGQASKATEKEEALSGQWPLSVSLDPLLRPTPRPPHAVPGQQIDVRSKGRLMQEISREEISPSHARSRRIYSSASLRCAVPLFGTAPAKSDYAKVLPSLFPLPVSFDSFGIGVKGCISGRLERVFQFKGQSCLLLSRRVARDVVKR